MVFFGYSQQARRDGRVELNLVYSPVEKNWLDQTERVSLCSSVERRSATEDAE